MKFKKSKSLQDLVVTSDPKMTRMIAKLTEVMYEHKGWKFLKVSPAMAKRIDKVADPIIQGKVKGVRWMGSMDKTSAAIREKAHKSLKFRKPTAKEHKEIMVRHKEMKSGAVKGIEVHPE